MSRIEWTDATVNPVIGCSKVSQGCKHCYAESMKLSGRFKRGPHRRYLKVLTEDGRWTGQAYLDREAMAKMQQSTSAVPMRARNADGSWRPARIFCVSMGDMFHETLGVDDVAEVWKWMASFCEDRDGRTRRGPTWIIATKRAGRAGRIIPQVVRRWTPRPVVHLLTSIESQEYAAPRLNPLMELRRGPGGDVELVGVSAEPLLGPLDLGPWIDRLGWVIVGGESGKGARPLEVQWVEHLVRQSQDAAVPVFVKQLGRRPVLSRSPEDIEHQRAVWPGRLGVVPVVADESGVTAWLTKKGGDPEEWPQHLRVREWPS